MPAERKSAARKRLHGTARADRAARVDYAERLTEPPPPPRKMPADARAIWRHIAAAAVGIGVLTRADLPLVELLVSALAAEDQAQKLLAAEGLTIAAGSGGRKKHPGAAIAESARGQALAMMRELGLSPKSRQAIDAAPPSRGANPFLRFGIQNRPRDELDAFLATDPDLKPTRAAPARSRRVQ